MAENENLVETTAEEAAAPQEKSSTSFGAKVKEWFRKFTVKLKRKTQMIPLVVILITSLVYLCCTKTYAQVIEGNSGIPNLGIAMFVNTLLSILVLAVFLNAFPKRRKPKIVFVVMVFVVLAIILGLDLLYYFSTKTFVNNNGGDFILNRYPEINKAYKQLTVHMVFVGISIVVFAFLPLYKKGINKINTRKNLEENNLSGEIDTSAEV